MGEHLIFAREATMRPPKKELGGDPYFGRPPGARRDQPHPQQAGRKRTSWVFLASFAKTSQNGAPFTTKEGGLRG